jgi:tetratricopeptide (TPR) repeat protein
MKKLFLLLLLLPLFVNAQSQIEICECVDAQLQMAKEMKEATADIDKSIAIREKYKEKRDKCNELSKDKSDEERKKMNEQAKNCPASIELEKLRNERKNEEKEELKRNDDEAKKIYHKGRAMCMNLKSEISNYQIAINYFSDAIKLDENFYQAYCYRGKAKLILGDYTGAIKDLNSALFIDTSKTNYIKKDVLFSSSNLTAEIYLYRGEAKNRLGDYRGAIIDLSKAIQYNDHFVNGSAFFELGYAKSYLKDYQGALLNYNKAIQLDSYYDVAYYNRALIKLNLNDKEGACLDFSKAGELGYEKAYEAIRENCN